MLGIPLGTYLFICYKLVQSFVTEIIAKNCYRGRIPHLLKPISITTWAQKSVENFLIKILLGTFLKRHKVLRYWDNRKYFIEEGVRNCNIYKSTWESMKFNKKLLVWSTSRNYFVCDCGEILDNDFCLSKIFLFNLKF